MAGKWVNWEKVVRKGSSKISDRDLEKVVRKSEKIREKISGSNVFTRLLKDVELMLSLVKDYRNKRYREMPWWVISAVVFALIYVFNPFDMVPDAIPVLGLLDDGAVVTMALYMVEKDLHKYAEWKARQEKYATIAGH